MFSTSCVITLISHPLDISKFPTAFLRLHFSHPAGSEHAQWTCPSPYKVLFFSYPSDLMKSTVVDESLSSTKLQFCSRENQLATIITTEWESCINYYSYSYPHHLCLMALSYCWLLVPCSRPGLFFVMSFPLFGFLSPCVELFVHDLFLWCMYCLCVCLVFLLF